MRVDGAAEVVAAEHPEIRGVMSAWHEKYRSMFAGDGFERLTRQVASLGFLQRHGRERRRVGPPHALSRHALVWTFRGDERRLLCEALHMPVA